MGHAHTDLYEGHPSQVVARVLGAAVRVRRSLLWRMPFIRVQLRDLEARAHLMLADRTSGARRAVHLARVRFLARRVRDERAPCHDPIADVLAAGVAHHTHDRAHALALLRSAEAGFTTSGEQPRLDAAERARRLLQGETVECTPMDRTLGWVPA
jgi:hypothetical protein